MGSDQPVADSVDDAETFNHDGFLIAKALYSAEEMLDWKARIIDILEAGGHLSATKLTPVPDKSLTGKHAPGYVP